jgi:hypothetical protein
MEHSDDLGLMVKGLQQRETARDKKLDDMAVEQVQPVAWRARDCAGGARVRGEMLTQRQAKLDKRIQEEKVSSDIRFQRSAEGLGDAVKRVELLEEFLFVAASLARCEIVTLCLHAYADAALRPREACRCRG